MRPVRPGADRTLGAAAVFDARARALLLAGFALLVVLHLPLAWIHGRFLDEEGTIFFAFAWHRPGEALWRSFAGYLNLAANAATLADVRLVRAGIVPLERAPYVTMGIAVALQCVPAALILTGRGRWLANRAAVIACLLFLALDPMTEEVFANVLHIQFHLALACAVILALDPPRRRWAWAGYGAILVLAPLCGPGAIVLVPLFALRCVVDRSPARLAQTLLIGAGAGVQLLLFFAPSPLRGQFLDPATLAVILFLRLAAMPYVSSVLANVVGHWVHASYVGGGVGWWSMVPLAAAWSVALVVAAWRGARDPAIWLVAAALLVAAVSFGGGMIVADPSDWFSVGAGERYNYIPLALIGFALVAMTVRPRARARGLGIALVALTLLSGAIIYWRPIAELRRGPSWPAEVARWRADRSYPLRGWPAEWSLDLSDGTRACRPLDPRRLEAGSGDPGYCESAWYARVHARYRRLRERHGARVGSEGFQR